MRFLIYGAGALGQALGCLLTSRGHTVSLLLRQRFADLIKQNGLHVSGIFGSYQADAAKLILLTDSSGIAGGHYDFVLITTKSYDTASAIADLAVLSASPCPIVSVQNGCGNLEQICENFGTGRSLAARVITGFEIEGAARVKITVSADAVHIGGAHAGHVPEHARILAAAIDESGLPCVAVADIHQSLFAKLLYNCALNPLGAILGVNYGALSEHEQTRAIMDKVIEETFSVIQALGIELPWPSAEQYRHIFYQQLLPATYHHRPSMLQDLENGKPTEVDALVGYVVQQARQAAIAVPYCELLANLIRFRERQGSPAQSFPD